MTAAAAEHRALTLHCAWLHMQLCAICRHALLCVRPLLGAIMRCSTLVRPSLSVCPSLSNEVFCLPNICTDFARATMLRCVSLQESSSSLGLYLKIKILAYGTPSRALHLDKFRRAYGTSIVASCCQLSSTNVDARCHKLAPVVFRRSNSVDCRAGKNLVLKTGLGFFRF